jgi:hypothetical protein
MNVEICASGDVALCAGVNMRWLLLTFYLEQMWKYERRLKYEIRNSREAKVIRHKA